MVVADLGPGVLDTAMVETPAYVPEQVRPAVLWATGEPYFTIGPKREISAGCEAAYFTPVK